MTVRERDVPGWREGEEGTRGRGFEGEGKGRKRMNWKGEERMDR